MAILDGDLSNKNEAQDEKAIPFFNSALRYGLILSAVGIISTVLQFMLGAKWIQWVAMLVNIGVLIYAVREHQRNNLGGFISFGRVFSFTFAANAISGAIGSIFNYIYVNFINPSVMEDIVAQIRSDSERNNTPEEAIQMAVDYTTWMFTSVGGIGVMFLFVLIFAAIVSVVLAAVLKRNRPLFS
jgi:hypothetical protein